MDVSTIRPAGSHSGNPDRGAIRAMTPSSHRFDLAPDTARLPSCDHPVTRPAAPRGPAVWQPCLVLARPARSCCDLKSQVEPVRLRCSTTIDDEGGGESPRDRKSTRLN